MRGGEQGRHGIPPVCRSVGGLPLFMGYALLGVWMGQAGATGVVPIKVGPLGSFTASALAFEALGLVVLALVARRTGSLRASGLVYGLALGCVVATPVLSLAVGSGPVGSGPVSVAFDLGCGALCGFARALVFLLWTDAFSLLSMGSLCICLTSAWFARIGLGMASGFVAQPVVSCVLACVAGVASMIMCRHISYSDGPACEVERPDEPRMRVRFPWRPVLLMVVYYPAFCLVLMAVGDKGVLRGLQDVGGMAVYALVLLVSLVAFRRFRLSQLYTVALPCMCAALLGTMASIAWPTNAVLLLAGVGFHSFSLFTYLLLFSISFRYGVSTLWLLGLTNVPRVLIKGAAGMMFGTTGLSTQDAIFNQAVAVLAVALIVASLLLAFGREFGSTWGIVADDANWGRRMTNLVDQCRDLSRLYGLTRREEDVLILLAQGNDVAAIGEQLVLSRGTVRNHVQHVYRKFDVHSREELVARVGTEG